MAGPDEEIERFKQTCLVTVPPPPFPNGKGGFFNHPDYGNGIDFYTHEGWKTDLCIYWSTYCFHEGQHQLSIKSAWKPPLESLEKISALFPALTFDLNTADEFCNFAYKGTIKAGVADLHKDVEAIEQYEAMMGGEVAP